MVSRMKKKYVALTRHETVGGANSNICTVNFTEPVPGLRLLYNGPQKIPLSNSINQYRN
jgi:hypothetical protein